MEALQADDPRQVGDHVVQGRLAVDTRGGLYLAHGPGGTPVAVQTVRDASAHDMDGRAQLRGDVDAARRGGSAFHAELLDGRPDDTLPWVAFRLPVGASVGQHVEGGDGRPGHTLDPAALARLGVGVALALLAHHQRDRVHGRVTPDTVILTDARPCLVGLGLSRTVDRTLPSAHGPSVGVPGYLAPERLGTGAVGPEGDIFSLGALLAFAAAGQPPFGSDDVHAVNNRVLTRPPDLSAVPTDLRDLVTACLARNPADRPTALDLVEQFTVRLIAAPGPTPPPTAPPPGPGQAAAPPWPTPIPQPPPPSGPPPDASAPGPAASGVLAPTDTARAVVQRLHAEQAVRRGDLAQETLTEAAMRLPPPDLADVLAMLTGGRQFGEADWVLAVVLEERNIEDWLAPAAARLLAHGELRGLQHVLQRTCTDTPAWEIASVMGVLADEGQQHLLPYLAHAFVAMHGRRGRAQLGRELDRMGMAGPAAAVRTLPG